MRLVPWCAMQGIVTNRQQPETANGTTFMTLEDETGHHPLIPSIVLVVDAAAQSLLILR